MNPIFRNRHHIVQRRVFFVVLSALHFNGKDPPCLLDNKIKLPLFLAVIIIQGVSVGMKFLSHHILIDSSFVDIFLFGDDFQLAGFSIYGGEQSHI